MIISEIRSRSKQAAADNQVCFIITRSGNNSKFARPLLGFFKEYYHSVRCNSRPLGQPRPAPKKRNHCNCPPEQPILYGISGVRRRRESAGGCRGTFQTTFSPWKPMWSTAAVGGNRGGDGTFRTVCTVSPKFVVLTDTFNPIS